MGKNVRVALMQLSAGANREENMVKGLSACEKAKENGADAALFPEMFSCGYRLADSRKDMRKIALPADGEFVSAFRQKAARLDMAIGITLLEQTAALPKNTLILFDRHGRKVLKYSKVHTCDFDREKFLRQGEDFYVCELDTAAGKVKIGAMICYDREFPESARILMLKGAEIILVPNACPMEINRISQLRARAYENMVGIATVNYPAGVPDCNGNSTAFDGMVYIDGLTGPLGRDTLILQAPENEGIYYADFPIERMRRYRLKEVHGNAYRRPGMYTLLTDSKTRRPFIRKDARK